MTTLYSYPDLFGVADNNPFGLKVYAFMRLCGVPFDHRHVLDTKQAPRGQLPYLVDGDQSVGDSDAIINYLKHRYGLSIDEGLSEDQRYVDLWVRRTLDDLYWPMSYSRWKDDRYWPRFRKALLGTHADITEEALEAAREYNWLRYHYQGIGRYEPEQVYERGMDNLRAVSHALGSRDYAFGSQPRSLDAAIYGFIANIYFYDIDTPLKQCVLSTPNLARHCQRLHAAIGQSYP
jgi:glutathione S-transferase